LSVGLHGRLVIRGDGAAGPVGCGEELGFQPLIQPEDGARNGYADAGRKRRSLRVDDRRGAELARHAVQGRNREERRPDVVAEDGGQQIGCRANHGDGAGRGLEGKNAGVLEQDDALLGGLQ